MTVFEPRVAKSLEDLRVGMWVSYKTGETWETGLISELRYVPDSGNQLVSFERGERPSAGVTTCLNMNYYTIIILSDPPVVPSVLSKKAQEHLAQLFIAHDTLNDHSRKTSELGDDTNRLIRMVRAFVNEVREPVRD